MNMCGPEVGTGKKNKGLRGSYTAVMKEGCALKYDRLIHMDFSWPLKGKLDCCCYLIQRHNLLSFTESLTLQLKYQSTKI